MKVALIGRDGKEIHHNSKTALINNSGKPINYSNTLQQSYIPFFDRTFPNFKLPNAGLLLLTKNMFSLFIFCNVATLSV